MGRYINCSSIGCAPLWEDEGPSDSYKYVFGEQDSEQHRVHDELGFGGYWNGEGEEEIEPICDLKDADEETKKAIKGGDFIVINKKVYDPEGCKIEERDDGVFRMTSGCDELTLSKIDLKPLKRLFKKNWGKKKLEYALDIATGKTPNPEIYFWNMVGWMIDCLKNSETEELTFFGGF